MTWMTGPDCAVMCNLRNTLSFTHTAVTQSSTQSIAERRRDSGVEEYQDFFPLMSPGETLRQHDCLSTRWM